MIDLKHFGLNKRDKLFDDIATGIAWIVVTLLLLFYAMGMVPQ